ncbi:flagellar filament capping protein FliD [Blastococcus sp. SYSU D00820]
MSLSTGLISGLDTASLISQLMQVEANPQTLLKTKLSATQADAAAYRAVNTRFDALRTAAAALTADGIWSATKATSSNTSVAASSGSTALPGSVTFTVDELASAHSVRSTKTWTVPSDKTAADVDFGETSVDVKVGGTTTSIALDTDASGTASLAEAVAAINAKTSLGLTASVVQVAPGEYRMQVVTKTAGEDGAFEISGAAGFVPLNTGTDAKLTIGSGPGAFSVTSTSNTFAGLMPDTTVTVSKKGETATISVGKDPDAAAGKLQSLVDTANGLLESIAAYTKVDSTAATLKGDSTLRNLSGQILDIVSRGFNGVSAATLGLQLTDNGRLLFTKATFTEKLAADPAAVRDMLTKKTTVSNGTDGKAGTPDDVVSATGLVAQLEVLARTASDSTTGTLTLLANSRDTTAKDLTARIADWDIRLELRKTTLTRQFTAMETALGTLQNQSSWLASQIGGLPSWSRS